MTGWGFLVVGLLVPLLLNEVSDLGSWIAGRLLSWGARRLGSPEKAERYNEEWAADLERVPGKLTKVGYALGVVAWGCTPDAAAVRVAVTAATRAGGYEQQSGPRASSGPVLGRAFVDRTATRHVSPRPGKATGGRGLF